jgi:hypothetical protein
MRTSTREPVSVGVTVAPKSTVRVPVPLQDEGGLRLIALRHVRMAP